MAITDTKSAQPRQHRQHSRQSTEPEDKKELKGKSKSKAALSAQARSRGLPRLRGGVRVEAPTATASEGLLVEACEGSVSSVRHLKLRS